MGYWLARERTGQAEDVLTRFDPRFWTVNFPRPMMASVVSTAPDALRVDAVFYRADDLAGLIWESEDRHDHPLLGYATARDYRRCRLRFRWRSGGVVALDAVHGPVLTIEGRDASGAPRAWYVRLWNYAVGTPEDAVVAIDFATTVGGFDLPADADPLWAGDVDRMFVSLVGPGYSGEDALLPAPAEGWAELSEIVCDGPDSVLAIGAAILPEHGLSIASGYDDSYHLTPARLLRNVLHLGYRGCIVHYVGMSHYFRLEANGGGLYASLAGGVLNAPCAAWHRSFAAEAVALGYGVIWSLSYELLDQHCRGDWKQRAADGTPGLTGWEPPSALLSPAHEGAMGYLRQVAQAFVGIALEAGQAVRFQIGEPWWWVLPDGRPCLYDGAARAALDPVAIASVRGPLDAAQTALLDRAGVLLARSTAALTAAVREVAPEAETLLLAYLPTVLDAAAPELKRANLPVGWASPAFDVLQLEDYDWAAVGNTAATARGVAAAEARLGYSPERQHYFAGFVLRPEDAGQWAAIDAAAETARARGIAATFLWALPQVLRDGYVHFDEGEDAMQAFDDVRFPLALGREAEVAPEMSTAIVTSAGGSEKRNADWAEPRTRYDVGPGVRSEADIATLLDFFRARMGPARAFRLSDPFDHASADEVAATDQAIGVGDDIATAFPLVKHYGAMTRRITRPVAGSVRVAIDGVETQRFSLVHAGVVALDAAPPHGAVVTAGYRFDVPVRFAEDRLTVNRATFRAGAAPSVPLVEVREA
ncbi:TIGR02217 family protein [Sphingomonas sp. ac-8]|uniref:phage distal tail protein, Rcc01695 family n=1 Tax=Sphingomonas sp. ac-8 TaxID=3242977 RepID=UPI003A80BC2B